MRAVLDLGVMALDWWGGRHSKWAWGWHLTGGVVGTVGGRVQGGVGATEVVWETEEQRHIYKERERAREREREGALFSIFPLLPEFR